MEKNVTFAIAIALALSMAFLSAGCSSHRHIQTDQTVEQRDTFAGAVSVRRQSGARSLSSRVTTSDRNAWRITWRYDTSKPSDPETHMPPLSSIEVEGEAQAQEERSSSDDVAVEAEDDQTKVSGGGGVNVSASEHRDTEVRDRAGRIMGGVIPGVLFIMIIIMVAKDIRNNAGKDTSV